MLILHVRVVLRSWYEAAVGLTTGRGFPVASDLTRTLAPHT